MESRNFIREATTLIADIDKFSKAILSNEEEQAQGLALQKRVNSTFAGLQNPTLPSAGKLKQAAIDAGFQVDQRVVQRLSQAEALWAL